MFKYLDINRLKKAHKHNEDLCQSLITGDFLKVSCKSCPGTQHRYLQAPFSDVVKMRKMAIIPQLTLQTEGEPCPEVVGEMLGVMPKSHVQTSNTHLQRANVFVGDPSCIF